MTIGNHDIGYNAGAHRIVEKKENGNLLLDEYEKCFSAKKQNRIAFIYPARFLSRRPQGPRRCRTFC